MNEKIQIPTSFWIISGLALVWNLTGVFAFYSDVTISQEALSAMPEAQRHLYETAPGWTKVAYGFATIGGLIGSIGLIIRKSWAVPVFLVSLLAIVIQMSYSLFLTNAIETMGTKVIYMPIVITLIGGLLYYFAKRSTNRGLLS